MKSLIKRNVKLRKKTSEQSTYRRNEPKPPRLQKIRRENEAAELKRKSEEKHAQTEKKRAV